MTDIEISRKSIKKNIVDVAKSIGIDKDNLILYGDYKAKIKTINTKKSKAKLILVTAVSPTPMGEGKTTVSIGLGDALHRMGKKTIISLREPSMGPVFGMKGGATGGGYSQVVPMEDINLHFTGDFHAITSANNLISAAIDNHIYFGNELDIQNVLFKRCLDVNDRALRDIDLGTRHDSFTITSASEIMALFCLATSFEDLKKRLGDIIIGTNSHNEYVYVRDLHIEGSLVALLKDAFLPNIVQTLENTPAFIHGGPFANIAHGCNSVVSTKTALNYADYVVTEAGFGADLGAEKFFDIKCRVSGLKPDVVVLVTTLKAIKYHGGVPKDQVYEKNDEALIRGFENLDKHCENMKKYGVDVIVCLNKFSADKKAEIELLRKHCEENNYKFSISSAYVDGGSGAEDLAKLVVDSKGSKFKLLYDENDSIENKIEIICKDIYGASDIKYSDLAKEKIKVIYENNYDKLPICIAKTQYSFSDDSKKPGVPKDFEVTVRDVNLYNGAGFITILLGDIMTMPGLSRKPNYLNIDFVKNNIIGLQ